MRTLYLKAPFFKAIKNRQTKYTIRLEDDLVQYEGGEIVLADARQSLVVFVTRARRVPVSRLPYFILNSLGYHTKPQLINSLKSFYHVKNIDQITVLEVIVQEKK